MAIKAIRTPKKVKIEKKKFRRFQIAIDTIKQIDTIIRKLKKDGIKLNNTYSNTVVGRNLVFGFYTMPTEILHGNHEDATNCPPFIQLSFEEFMNNEIAYYVGDESEPDSMFKQSKEERQTIIDKELLKHKKWRNQ